MSYDALLLDFDGVVVNVLPDERRLPAFRDQIAAEMADYADGIDEDVVAALSHSVKPDELAQLSERTGIDPETLWRTRDDALAAALDRAAAEGQKTPFEDVTALSDVSRPIGIVSNNQHRVVESLSDRFDLTPQFETIRAREPHPDSLHDKKPEPTFLHDTARELGVETALFVGDKESDIRAGQAAGMDTVLLRREHNSTIPVEAEPTYEAASLTEVVSLLDGSAR